MPGDVTPVHVAYPELRRMAPEALRVAGLPLALADEAADLLAWTEAAVGGGLAFVRTGEHARGDGSAVEVVRTEAGAAVLDCGGTSLLEIGLRVVDFACAGAPARAVLVRNTCGPQFLPYLVRRCALRGYATEARYAGPRFPGRRSRSVGRAEAAAGPDGLQLAVWPDEGRDGYNLDGTRDGLGAVVVTCRRGEGSVDAAGADGACEARAAEAVRRGMDVDDADYRAFSALAVQIRVPTSERSRAQAG